MESNTKKGNPKILKKCTLPITAVKEVDIIVTELRIMEVTKEGVLLNQIASGVTVEEIQAKTEAKLIISDNLEIIE